MDNGFLTTVADVCAVIVLVSLTLVIVSIAITVLTVVITRNLED